MATYNYTNGDGVDTLDATTPNGATEPVSVLDDAVRQIKAFLKDPSAGVKSLIARITAAEGTITTIQNTLNSTTPIGCVMPYAGSSAPSGWLICDGSAVARAAYPDLFTCIGVIYGIGNGTTTFNLPDMRGRVPMGPDDGTSRVPGVTQGGVGGAYQHALTEAEGAPHSHFCISNVTAWDENRVALDGRYIARGSGSAGESEYSLVGTTQNLLPSIGPTSQTPAAAPHNNLQPYLCLKFIIKY